MGPVRGRLTSGGLSPRGQIYAIVFAILYFSPAHADVCQTARPGWDGAPVGAIDEALSLFLSPAGLVLLCVSLLALRFRHQWIGLGAVVLWTAFITAVTMADPTGVRMEAMNEGCIGPPTLFIVAVAAICVAIVLYTKPRRSGADGSET